MVFQPKYWERGVPGAVAKIYVRKTVEEMLLAAANLLPEGYKLKILDAWRPAAVQKALFDEYYSVLQERFQGDKSEDELKEMASQFVSYPSEDPNRPFVHATGGAVDLTIVDAKGKELNMGTAFDDFSDAAHTTYFENTDCTEIRDNRRLLYHVMAGVGFTNYPGEWWHYDFGDRFWAAIAQRDSIYRGIYELPEI
jgi:D-alanyl-D-alanine dipeptidase